MYTIQSFSIIRTSEHCHNENDINCCLTMVTRFGLHGLILCGGFATVSTSAILSETFLQRGSRTSVVAVPVSIESGLPSIETVSNALASKGCQRFSSSDFGS